MNTLSRFFSWHTLAAYRVFFRGLPWKLWVESVGEDRGVVLLMTHSAPRAARRMLSSLLLLAETTNHRIVNP